MSAYRSFLNLLMDDQLVFFQEVPLKYLGLIHLIFYESHSSVLKVSSLEIWNTRLLYVGMVLSIVVYGLHGNGCFVAPRDWLFRGMCWGTQISTSDLSSSVSLRRCGLHFFNQIQSNLKLRSPGVRVPFQSPLRLSRT